MNRLVVALGLIPLVTISCGEGEQTPPQVEIVTAKLKDVHVNATYDVKIEVKGGTSPFTFSIESGMIPPGIELKATTGQLTGIAGEAGTHTFTAKVTDSKSQSATKELSIFVVPDPLEIVTMTLPSGKEGTPYDESLTARGGIPPLTWTLSDGDLANGLTLESEGRIFGTPSTYGGFDFTVQVTDDVGTARQQELHLFLASLNPMITTSTIPKGHQGLPYSTRLDAQGGMPPYTWEVVAGTAPVLLANDGSLAGVPTDSGEFTFTVRVSDSDQRTDEADFTMRVIAPLVINTTSLPQAIANRPYSFTLQAEGGEPPYTWVLANGNPPTGITFDDSGTFSGQSNAPGDHPLTIRVLDSVGSRVSALFDFKVSDRFVYEVEPNLSFPPICSSTVTTSTIVSYITVPIDVPDSMMIEDIDVSIDISWNTTAGQPAANDPLRILIYSPDLRYRTHLCGNGAGIPGGRTCGDLGGIVREYDDEAGQADQPERPLNAFDGINPQGTWFFKIAVVDPTCANEGLINSISLSIKDDRSTDDYVLVYGYRQGNLLLYPMVRLNNGAGMSEFETTISATAYHVGPNGYREGGKGDDVPDSAPLTWQLQNAPVGTTMTPDGRITAGMFTGEGTAVATGGGYSISVPIYVVAPDWVPAVRVY